MAIMFVPQWLGTDDNRIDNIVYCKKVAEIQADFFNWLYDSALDVLSRRLPTTDPLTLFKAIMHVDDSKFTNECDIMYLHNMVEKPRDILGLDYLYGGECTPDMDFEWVFTGDSLTSFSMKECVQSQTSFKITEVEKAKYFFMKGLFIHLRSTVKTTDGSSVLEQLFKNQPILSALYAAHVTAYNRF